jgi:glycosyltransferase involved in cell wall biosynthesis
MDISVVVPTYNKSGLLKGLIESLQNQTYSGKYEIIIVDDGSQDNTMDVVKGFSNIVYIRQKNKGPAAARNAGIRKARGKIVVFTDDDCLPSRNWPSELKKHFSNEAAAVEGLTVPASGKVYPDSHVIRNVKGSAYLTCNMAFLKSAIKKGFDENYRYPNREDSDLAFSLLKNGGKIVFSPKAVVRHRILKWSLKKMLRRKLFFESDVILFKKYPALYKKYMRFPFDRFAPGYVLFSLATLYNPWFLAAMPLLAAFEVIYRKYSFSPSSFIKFVISQTLGSFVNIYAVLRSCARNRVNPLRFL